MPNQLNCFAGIFQSNKLLLEFFFCRHCCFCLELMLNLAYK